jgi:hypothetical protein
MTELMKEFCIEIENKPGTIARICTALGTAGVNLKTIACESIGKQGFVRIIADNHKKAADVLDSKKLMYSENDVIVKAFDDKPNQLAMILDKVSAAGINMDAVYLMQSKNGKAQVVLVTDNVQKAMTILKA